MRLHKISFQVPNLQINIPIMTCLLVSTDLKLLQDARHEAGFGIVWAEWLIKIPDVATRIGTTDGRGRHAAWRFSETRRLPIEFGRDVIR